MNLDQSQLEFCRSSAQHIRLLAPAGCGKTSSLLHRCRAIADRSGKEARFLIVTFTKAATHEVEQRLATDPEFATIRDLATVSTLNAYGYRRMRDQLRSTKLLSSAKDRHFAVQNQLRPIWSRYPQIDTAVSRRGNQSRAIMNVIDALKNLGFDHTSDTNLERFRDRLESLQGQGLSHRIDEQFDTLTRLGVLDQKGDDMPTSSTKMLYDRFFTFWRKAVASLHDQFTFTIDDQKYWCWLDMRSPDPDGKQKPPVTGVTRFDHILVDEFQDISPLDLALVKTLVERHRSTLTIVGDDDQAIFEWRGATPEYILRPDAYFDAIFETHILNVNYRSPQNVVEHSQRLIQNNVNRVPKAVSAAPGAHDADIKVIPTNSIGDRLRLVSQIARDVPAGGRVAVIGRVRSQLIPYEVFYASDGGPVKIATDLDAFGSSAFDDLMRLLEIWECGHDRQRPARAIEDALTVCNRVKRYPLNKKDRANVQRHLKTHDVRTCADGLAAIATYAGPKLSGKTHEVIHGAASAFINAGVLADAILAIADGFDGLRFDFERAEDDIWYTDPPLRQLAEMAREEHMTADDLIERMEAAKEQVQHYQAVDLDPAGGPTDQDRPLHLMTATRSKGKEFDTVVMLDTVEGLWPHTRERGNPAAIEAARRLFYVAFTRARHQVVMLTVEDATLSPFVYELGLPESKLPSLGSQSRGL